MLCIEGSLPESDLPRFTASNEWSFEQKLDGDRVVMVVQNGGIAPINRNGDRYSKRIPKGILQDFLHPSFIGEWAFDGELLGGRYNVFDIQMASNLGDQLDLREEPFYRRRAFLDGLFARWAPFHVDLVPCLQTPHGKDDLVNRVRAANGEGIVLKHKDGLYYNALRSHEMLKMKFTETADVIVKTTWREGKRSIGIEVFDSKGGKVDVGACTMTEKNLARVNVGDVVEVRYLYRGAGGNLFQPRFLRLRTDKPADQCLESQLKHVNKGVLL